MLHDFHQRHHRHRVEVVQAGKLRRALDVATQVGQRNRRGIGRQQCIRLELRLDRLIQIALGLRVFDDRLDHQVGLRHARAGQVAAQTRRHCRPLGIVLDALGEQLATACQRRIDKTLLAVLQCDVEALVSRPGGDIAAHDADADHMHMANWGYGHAGCVLAAQPFQTLGQEEDPDQVACGRRAGEFDHRLAFGRQARLDAATARPLPDVDQGIGRRVMLLARLAPHLLRICGASGCAPARCWWPMRWRVA